MEVILVVEQISELDFGFFLDGHSLNLFVVVSVFPEFLDPGEFDFDF